MKKYNKHFFQINDARGFKLMRNYLFLVLFLVMISSVSALEDGQNISSEDQSIICLNESRDILTELISENFTSLRINESLVQAENIFDAQAILKQNNKKYDFSLVIPYCEEIKAVKQKAFETRDEFIALKRFYSELDLEGMDSSSIDKIFFEIENEMKSERYEKVGPLINEAYDKIVNVRSDYIASKVFYRVVTSNLKQFLYENWIYFFFSFAGLFILFLIYKNTIFQAIIKRKIRKLEFRKDTLKGLIRSTQRGYFDKGNLSERIYTIRIKKFAEMIRDIDRQIPLLNEQLFKIFRVKSKGAKKFELSMKRKIKKQKKK